MSTALANPPPKKHGRQDEWPLELREQGYRLYAAKEHKMPEIAKLLGVPVNTLNQWSHKGKWKIRLAADDAGESTYDAATCQPSAKALREEGQSLGVKQSKYTGTMADEALRIAETISAMSPAQLVVNADKIAKLDAVARKALHLEEAKPGTIIQIGFLGAPPVETVKNLSRQATPALVGVQVKHLTAGNPEGVAGGRGEGVSAP